MTKKKDLESLENTVVNNGMIFLKEIEKPQHLKRNGVRFGLFKCVCGNNFQADVRVLLNPKSPYRGCGCKRKNDDIKVGDKIGEWTALSDTNQNKTLMLCSCGTERLVCSTKLRSGESTSCGCKRGSLISKAKTTHGMSGSHVLFAYTNMVTRCTKPSHEKYALYGGSGITVCDEWLNDFESFKNWYLSEPFHVGYQIDRIDGKLGYSPNNCRLVSPYINMLNRSFKSNKGINGVKVATRYSKLYFIVSIKYNGFSFASNKMYDYFEACCLRKSMENKIFSEFMKLRHLENADDLTLQSFITYLRERKLVGY